MRRLDKAGSIEWIDIHSGDKELSKAGISHAQAMRSLHVINENGQTHKGVPAFLLLWEKLPVYRQLAIVINKAPWLLTPLELGYAAFARVRPRLGRLRVRQAYRERPTRSS